MNILQYLLIVSALTSLIVAGPNLLPIQSYAAGAVGGGDIVDDKSTKDYKDYIHKDVSAKTDSTTQHLGQEPSATGL